MKLSEKLLIGAAIAICLLTLLSGLLHAEQVSTEQPTSDGSPGGQTKKPFKLPKLFDFAYFKERFGKKYATLSEELARKTYFVARAFRAFVSGMNFKWRRSSYYLAVNHMSDASPQELEARKNKHLAESNHEMQQLAEAKRRAVAQESLRKADDNDLPEFIPAEGENYEEAVKKLIEKHQNEPGYSELLQAESHSRKKRSVQDGAAAAGAKTPLRPREFSLDKLIKPGVKDAVPESPGVRAKLTNRVASNNPNYEPPEVMTQGLNDNLATPEMWVVEPKEDPRDVEDQLDSCLSDLVSYVYKRLTGQHEDEEEALRAELADDGRDLVYFDHRDSQCLTQPREQGSCGSCYAFSSIALMEWLYCKKTNKLVPFSEQYMIDCGKWRFGGLLRGCQGGADLGVLKFLENFGLERLSTYPYVMSEQPCPYPDRTDLKAVGYIKMKLNDFAVVQLAQWGEYIRYGPMLVSIGMPADYHEYSGGVHDGKTCGLETDHAQLLIGHGREDGQDYWLMRNSYGTKWGENGYYKISKSAPKNCFGTEFAFALGTKDARRYKVNPKENHQNRKFLEKRAKEEAKKEASRRIL